jgi:hypothetical protein
MAIPTLTPASVASKAILPATGSPGEVVVSLPYGVYSDSTEFLSGASAQVAYTYQKLGGEVLDIELSSSIVYAAYEEACLEYSYLINVHQSKNVLSDALGHTTGTFDHKGTIEGSPLSSSLGGTHVGLKYPQFEFSYAKRIGHAISTEAGVGSHGSISTYSCSVAIGVGKQDYDLQDIISSASANNTDAAAGGGVPYAGLVGNKKAIITRVYYKSPHAMWRFFGYYGGLNTVGNLSNYGMYADDSTFQLIPSWQNKAQAMTFEDNIYTRVSHYSYEIRNNLLRIYPAPAITSPKYMWVEFQIPMDPWEETDGIDAGVDGVNNMNTLPLDNLPYKNINSIGKQWIRRFALSLAKETLGQIRSKFSSIPIPGESVTLNGDALITQAREEQEKLREELKTVLDELTYQKLLEADANKSDNANKIQQTIPLPVFVG